MNISCTLEFEYPSGQVAENIAKSIKVDDENFVKTDVEGGTISAIIESNNIPSLLHTIEDYLACLSIAEKTVTDSLRGP